jgi:hypothetical protein
MFAASPTGVRVRSHLERDRADRGCSGGRRLSPGCCSSSGNMGSGVTELDFHADYVLHSSGVRLPSARNPTRDLATVRCLVGRAHAYHDSVAELRRLSLRSYEAPKEIPAGEGLGGPQERAVGHRTPGRRRDQAEARVPRIGDRAGGDRVADGGSFTGRPGTTGC